MGSTGRYSSADTAVLINAVAWCVAGNLKRSRHERLIMPIRTSLCSTQKTPATGRGLLLPGSGSPPASQGLVATTLDERARPRFTPCLLHQTLSPKRHVLLPTPSMKYLPQSRIQKLLDFKAVSARSFKEKKKQRMLMSLCTIIGLIIFIPAAVIFSHLSLIHI